MLELLPIKKTTLRTYSKYGKLDFKISISSAENGLSVELLALGKTKNEWENVWYTIKQEEPEVYNPGKRFFDSSFFKHFNGVIVSETRLKKAYKENTKTVALVKNCSNAEMKTKIVVSILFVFVSLIILTVMGFFISKNNKTKKQCRNKKDSYYK